MVEERRERWRMREEVGVHISPGCPAVPKQPERKAAQVWDSGSTHRGAADGLLFQPTPGWATEHWKIVKRKKHK